MLVGIGYGSDKTTVSVATGQNEYYPWYKTVTNCTNADRRAHKGAVVLVGFLAIPKGNMSSIKWGEFTDEKSYHQVLVAKMEVCNFVNFGASYSIRQCESWMNVLELHSRHLRLPNAVMVYIIEQYIHWRSILLITQSKFSLHQLCRGGVPGEIWFVAMND
jgi:hypothetical protein